MGVKGLWKLLDGTGRPVNLESLEGKILAVDISVWLNMAIKGMRDYHGHSSQTAHLTTLFNRVCKLLYYGVKPVFVFDGQAPALKQKTLRERRERKNFNVREGKKASEKILQNYLKKQILQEAVGKSSQEDEPSSSKSPDQKVNVTKPSKDKPQDKDIYDLPPLAGQLEDSDQEDLEEELKLRAELQTEYLDDVGHVDIAGILNMDIHGNDFDALPSDVQYEMLKDLKEVRKRRRTQLETMPEESNSFSDYQIAGLLAKRKITKKMEHVENKMSEENLAASSQMSGLDSNIMKDHAVRAGQLVSDATSRYIWMQKVKDKKFTDTIEEKAVISEDHQLRRHPLAVIHEENNPSTSKDSFPPRKEESPTIPSSQTKATEIILSSSSDTETPSNESKIQTIQSPLTKTTEIILSSSSDTEVLSTESKPQSESTQSPLKISVDTITVVDDQQPDTSNSMKQHNHHAIAKISLEKSNVSAENAESTKIESFKNIDTKATEIYKSDVLVPGIVGPTAAAEIGTQAVTEMRKENYQSLVSNDSEKPQIKLESNNIPVESPKSESGESSDDDFLDVPEQDYSNLPERTDTTTPEAANVVEDLTATVRKAEEEYDSMDSNPWEGLDVENIENFSSQLDAESKELQKLMQAKERAAKDLSQSAQLECQELLKLFGLPYIVSPQEAEAQCAALELLNLTHGTITEDSDIWLFGGRYVIKDMFSSKRDPAAFTSSDIEMQLGLTRDRFVCVALCSGSDYTTGIHGVGPVTAMEILREFEGEGIQGLVMLKKWWDQVCSSAKQALPTETKIKSQLRRINLKKDFPSEVVYKAYINPVVNDEKKNFEWGFPDLDELRNFATGPMSWTRQKVDEILLPLMKKLGQRRNSQTRITQFVSSMPRTANKKKSKRVMRAVKILTGKNETDDSGVPKKKTRRNVKTKKAKVPQEVKLNLSESSSDDD